MHPLSLRYNAAVLLSSHTSPQYSFPKHTPRFFGKADWPHMRAATVAQKVLLWQLGIESADGVSSSTLAMVSRAGPQQIPEKGVSQVGTWETCRMGFWRER